MRELPRESTRYWYEGPPPFVGWWNASVTKDDNVWRWWDGERWSHFVSDTVRPDTAGYFAARPTKCDPRCIRWTSYWPARVPRKAPLCPTCGEVL